MSFGPLTYSAKAVRTLLERVAGEGMVPPRLLRAAQGVAFYVFGARQDDVACPAEAWVTSTALNHVISEEFWGRVPWFEADRMVDTMCEAGVLSISEHFFGREFRTVRLSEEVLIKTWQVDLAGYVVKRGALAATLHELLDRGGGWVAVDIEGLRDTCGMGPDSIQRGINRLDRDGVIIRDAVGAGQLLAWSPWLVGIRWPGIELFGLQLGADERSLTCRRRIRIRLPDGKSLYLPPGWRIELSEERNGDVEVDCTDGKPWLLGG